MSTKFHPLPILILALVALIVSACAATPPVVLEQDPPPLAPTATPPPEQVVDLAPATDTSAKSEAQLAEWQSITPPDESVTFELPASWRHYGQDTNWSPDEGTTMIGLRMGFSRPGQSIERGLLPENAKITETQTEMINGMSVRRFEVATADAAETHLILVRADTMVFDFLLRTPTEAEMEALYPILVHAVESAVFP